jgi:hypothetical protein
MKLEYLEDGPNNSGLIRLYEYSQAEVHEVRKFVGELATGGRERIALDSENWVVPVGDCRLSLRRGSRDAGVRQLGPSNFECVLSAHVWNNVEGLLEPLCDSKATGFQWLSSQGKISLLISQSGRW